MTVEGTSLAARADKIRVVCWSLIVFYLIAKVVLLARGQPMSQWLDFTNPSLIAVVFYVSVCTLILRWAELEVRNRLPMFAQNGSRLIPVFVLATWHGKERLWKVFWIYSLMVFVTFNAALFVQLMRNPNSSRLLWSGIALMCTVGVVVALWRCAFNTRWRWLGFSARALAVFLVARFIFGVYWLAFGAAA